ncbi:type I restriction enzyme endonuclease domain-containing protein [Nostoc sp. FACHB-892]|uniref:type I restriction enzyme endonuclease domain-containing protein n=1 Tax=Nostoc sp. FACHB-892 TaxID=2692843 RepID=UPI003220787F
MLSLYLRSTEDELAFYDALHLNNTSVQALGDKILTCIARDLWRIYLRFVSGNCFNFLR